LASEMNVQAGAYNMHRCLRIQGDLDVGVLEGMFSQLVSRHEALRTRFVMVNGVLAQEISMSARIPIAKVDLRLRERGSVEEEAMRLAYDNQSRKFDLSLTPVARILLVRTSESEHLICIAVHHIICDGWSLNVIMRDVIELYQKWMQGRRSTLPELALQYSDYAEAQRKDLDGPVLSLQRSYWKRALAGHSLEVGLYPDRPRNLTKVYGGAREMFALSLDLSERLREVAMDNGVTLFMVLLATFSTLVMKISSNDDLVIACPASGRRNSALDHVVGPFANLLLLRIKLSDDPRFTQLLAMVRETVLQAIENQEIPFEVVVTDCWPQGIALHPFEVAFVLHNEPYALQPCDHFEVVEVELKRRSAKYKLALSVIDCGPELRGWIEYSEDSFMRKTIAGMIERFRMLLQSVVNDPASRLSMLSMMTEHEESRLAMGNGPATSGDQV
jgi:hypothetical protein